MVETVNQSPELTAANRAVTRALQYLSSSRGYLLAVGVTNEQIEAARTLAEGEVRAQYKELERQDPLSRITLALRESAQTEEERRLVEFNIRDLEFGRARLVEASHDSRSIASQDHRKRANGEVVCYAVITALTGPYGDREGKVFVDGPSRELSERFLKSMGVLEDYPSLQALLVTPFPKYDKWAIQREPTPPGPIIEYLGHNRAFNYNADNFITQLPTFIDGVEARLNLRNYQVGFSISPEALLKIQPSV